MKTLTCMIVDDEPLAVKISVFRWTMFCREKNNYGALKP